ncbi:hypothetical protein [Phycicoccus avicenniae]|uniref:hypothetical protein n=1 Tax=Phycicoccus avicenniae TaxID=2828860 RepID=UPI003D266A4C
MGHHLEGPLGRYTISSAPSRRDDADAPSPFVDLIRVGVSALARRPNGHQVAEGRGRHHA